MFEELNQICAYLKKFEFEVKKIVRPYFYISFQLKSQGKLEDSLMRWNRVIELLANGDITDILRFYQDSPQELVGTLSAIENHKKASKLWK